ncbi:MAG: DUF4249 domain-containing protein [Prolixibacteraceae bacterium]|nr:DUF4249 domain-containing protein [Prolixibacteraceae bacterium]
MMIKKCDPKLLLATLLLIFTNSCNDLVQDEFPDYPASPTVNSILVEGEPVELHLSRAGGLDSLSLPAINNAAVELWVDDSFSETMEHAGNGVYVSNEIARPLKTYTCKVAIPGEEPIECSQALPEPTPILNIEHIQIAGWDEEGTSYPGIKLTFPNSTTNREYFEVVVFYYYYDEGIRTAQIHTINDPVILNEGLPIALFSNEIISDSVYTLILNYKSGGAASHNNGPFRAILLPLKVELRTLTYDYYRYKKQYYLYEQGRYADGLINAVTASPVYSNIENGYGIFAGYSVSVSDTITPEPYED